MKHHSVELKQKNHTKALTFSCKASEGLGPGNTKVLHFFFLFSADLLLK